LNSQQSALVLVKDINSAVAIANDYAAEHLEIQTSNSSELAKQIRNAGAVFVGNHSPVSLGDYLAGSNHVLPTGSQAKRSAGLSVYSFLRPQQTVSFNDQALAEVSESLGIFANAEGLPGHGSAVRIRFKS
jgi:histidinol dehydrogenase